MKAISDELIKLMIHVVRPDRDAISHHAPLAEDYTSEPFGSECLDEACGSKLSDVEHDVLVEEYGKDNGS